MIPITPENLEKILRAKGDVVTDTGMMCPYCFAPVWQCADEASAEKEYRWCHCLSLHLPIPDMEKLKLTSERWGALALGMEEYLKS